MLNKTTGRYAFELTDHLGNVRAVVAKNTSNNTADVLSYTDYYPHGGVLPGRNFVSSPSYKMGYQGQEKDAETNFSNFELRQLDPRLGRWFNPDPMGQYFSPYLAMGNNPVSIVDPTGGWSLPSDGAIDYYIDGELVSQHVYNTYTNGAGSNILSITTAGMPEGYVLGYKYNGENYYGSHGYNNAIGKMFADAKSKGLIYGEQKNSNGEVVDKGLGEYVKQEIYEEGNLNNPSLNGTGEEDNLFDDKTIAYTMVLMYSDDYFNSLGVGFHSVKVDSRSIHERGLDLFVDNVKSADRWFEGKGGQNLAKFVNGFNPVFNVTNAVKIWTTGTDAYGQDASVADGFVEMASIVPVGKVLKIGKGVKGGVTIIGETMARVEAAASKVPGSKILDDMPKFSGTKDQITSQMMAYNRQWILKQLRSGRPILDIGKDLNRANPSIFYQMEQNMIKNYLKLHPNSVNIIKP